MNSLLSQTIDAPNRKGHIAPLWHTTTVILVLLSLSLLSVRSSRRGTLSHNHLSSYAVSFGMEWLVVVFILWGIRKNGFTLRRLLGQSRSGGKAWLEDLGLAIAFWFSSLLILGILAAALQTIHLGSPRKAALALAPATLPEAAAWILLSITAGICEELIFRGYLQQQFTAISNRASVGILVSAILFGVVHGYEGISGVVLVTVYGAMFSVLAFKQGALRTCMMAHAFHDAVTGIALALLRSSHQLS
jgi:CAAX protease family protein